MLLEADLRLLSTIDLVLDIIVVSIPLIWSWNKKYARITKIPKMITEINTNVPCDVPSGI